MTERCLGVISVMPDAAPQIRQGWGKAGSSLVRPADRCRGLARKDRCQGSAPRSGDAPAGAPLMVIFRGERMPGASRTASGQLPCAWSSVRRDGGDRPASGAGRPTGGGAAPGGLPPVRARHARRPGFGELPADLPSSPGAPPPQSRNLSR
jgi:hypothetical protein